MSLWNKVIDFFKSLFGFKKTPLQESVEKKSSIEETMKGHRDYRRSKYSDTILLSHYNIIKSQVERDGRSDDTLIEYVNELEYRGIKYE